MNIYTIELFKVFMIVMVGTLLYKIMFPIQNKHFNVKYPNVKVNIIGKTLRKSDLIEYCAIKMYKGGCDKEEVMTFIDQAFKTKNKEELLDLFVETFYIY